MITEIDLLAGVPPCWARWKQRKGKSIENATHCLFRRNGACNPISEPALPEASFCPRIPQSLCLYTFLSIVTLASRIGHNAVSNPQHAPFHFHILLSHSVLWVCEVSGFTARSHRRPWTGRLATKCPRITGPQTMDTFSCLFCAPIRCVFLKEPSVHCSRSPRVLIVSWSIYLGWSVEAYTSSLNFPMQLHLFSLLTRKPRPSFSCSIRRVLSPVICMASLLLKSGTPFRSSKL